MAYDGSIKIDTKIDTSGFKTGVEKIKSMAKTGVSVVATTLAGISAAIGAGATAAVAVSSDFESQMSRVSAIAGATDNEFNALKQQAIDLGASTAFSAKEAAEGMESLASAGFTVAEIAEAMPGMLDLAASSGESLAISSDIAASTLRGFGLAASDASHVADVLAKNAADTNAAVADTGEAMKYIAPLAKAAGISMEETAAAIGIMADSGIKGGQAGTTLRGALSRLANPTKNMTDVMDALNISFYNSDGKMKSLSEQCKMLKTATKDMTDEQRNQAIVTLYGQEALSGMLALINAEDGQLEKLTKSYEDCDGAAADMAKTMQDNLKAKLEELSGSFETLSITIYDELKEPLKDAAEEGVNYVNRLTEAFTDGGLTSMLEEAGSIFGELAVRAAEAAPDMINASMDFMQAFVDGIADNSSKLADSAVNIIQTLISSITDHAPKLLAAAKTIVYELANNLTRLLPTELQAPIKEAIKTIQKSFESGGLKKAINTVKTLILNLSKAISNIAKVVMPPLAKAIDFVSDKLNILIPIAASALTAWKAWKIISSITALVKSHAASVTAESLAEAASIGTITLKQIAVAALTGEISLATAAQYALNIAMSLNPAMLVLTAIAALTVGIAAFALANKDAISSADSLAAAEERLNTANQNLGSAYEDIGNKFSDFCSNIENSGSIFDDFNENIIISDSEKQQLADNMDSVQGEITEICRTASEERRELTGGEVKRLEELFAEMHKLAEQELMIEQKKQGVVTKQAEDLNNAAGLSLDEYTQRAKILVNTADETRTAVLKKAYEQYTEELALLDTRFETDSEYTQKEYDADREAAEASYQQAIDAANKEAGDTLEILKDGYYDRADILRDYTDQLSDLHDEESKEEETHQANMESATAAYNDAMAKAMEDGVIDRQEAVELGRIANEKDNALTEENTRHKKKLGDIRNKQQELLNDDNYQNQLTAFINLMGLYETYTGKTDTKAQGIVSAFIEPFDDLPDETKDKFKSAMQGAYDGLDEKQYSLFNKAASIAGSVINTFKKIFDEHSPSKVFKKIFKYTLAGGADGLDDEAPKLYKQADDVASTFTKRMQAKVSADGLVAKMRSAVNAGRALVAQKLTANVVHDVNMKNDDNNKKVVLKGDIQTHLGVNGREFAIATVPYISEELAWEDR